MKGAKIHPHAQHLVGLEGSGTVVAIGENPKLAHKIGDRVHVAGLGTHGQYFLTNSENCISIEGGLSFEEAASHFINPGTVCYMGRVAEIGGHKAVIHTA